MDVEAWKQPQHISEGPSRRERRVMGISRMYLQVPTGLEALCYQLHRLEGRSQLEIAKLLNMPQGSVSRCVRRAATKIEALRRSGRFDADEIDKILRKLSGLKMAAA